MYIGVFNTNYKELKNILSIFIIESRLIARDLNIKLKNIKEEIRYFNVAIKRMKKRKKDKKI